VWSDGGAGSGDAARRSAIAGRVDSATDKHLQSHAHPHRTANTGANRDDATNSDAIANRCSHGDHRCSSSYGRPDAGTCGAPLCLPGAGC
jgi:hypothetical protein